MKFRPTAWWRMRISPGPGSHGYVNNLEFFGTTVLADLDGKAHGNSAPVTRGTNGRHPAMNLQALPERARYIPGHDSKTHARHGCAAGDRALLWAGNAVVGRLVHAMIPPITLNFFRWVLAFAILLPLATGCCAKTAPVAALAALCSAGPAGHRALQRAAVHGAANLHPINVTLVGSSMPVWMLAVGALFWCLGHAPATVGRGALHHRGADRAQPW